MRRPQITMAILFSIFISIVWAFWYTRILYGQSEPYYKGETIRIVSGTSAGRTYDVYARLIAQHLGKYISGRPEFVVQNMPGTGSVIAANVVYGVAKPDGLTIASINPAIYFN